MNPIVHLCPSSIGDPKARGSHRCRCPRAFHLLDVENLLGVARDPESVRVVWERYQQAVRPRTDDLMVAATGPLAAPVTWFGLPSSARRLIGRGRDGADLALIAAVDVDLLSRRFGRVVIASGDHIFAPVAAALRCAGLEVWQVLGAGRPNAGLAAICNTQVSLFPAPPTYAAA